jgi:hypothetical protein
MSPGGQWEEFERQQRRARRRGTTTTEVIDCPRCGCSWFQVVYVNRFSTQQVVLLQDPVPIYPDSIPILICAACGKPTKHSVYYTGTTRDGKLYQGMLDEVTFEPEPKPEEKPDEDATDKPEAVPASGDKQ